MVGSQLLAGAVSVLVATLASYTALDLATRITASKGAPRASGCSGGAFSMGTGIWSMHFIGMLAFSLPIPMGYDVPITLLSMLIAVVVSGFALLHGQPRHAQPAEPAARRRADGPRHRLDALHRHGGDGDVAADPLRPAAVRRLDRRSPSRAALAALWIAFTLRSRLGADDLRRSMRQRGDHGLRHHRHALHRHGGGAASRRTRSASPGSAVDNSWMAATIAVITLPDPVQTAGAVGVRRAAWRRRPRAWRASLQEANAELQHMVLHDAPHPSCPTAAARGPHRPGDRRVPALRDAAARCCSSTSTASRRSTIRSAISSATSCCAPWPERLRAGGARRGHGVAARAATSSWCCCAASRTPTTPTLVGAQDRRCARAQPVRSHGHELRVDRQHRHQPLPATTASSAQALITNADAAMYHVKKSGRNGFQFFAPEMSTFFPQRLALGERAAHRRSSTASS